MFKRLTELDLSVTATTNAGTKELAPLTNLTRLDLHHDTDAGMTDVAKLKRFHQLDLADTKLTNVGLFALSPLTWLTALDVDNTEVTEDGIKQFKFPLPWCSVYKR